jgi:membrane fusion protein, multidrug efflux system
MPDDGGGSLIPQLGGVTDDDNQSPTQRSDDATEWPDGPQSTSRPMPRRGQRRVVFRLLPFAQIGGGYQCIACGQVMSTDDAYVDADKVGISTDVSCICQRRCCCGVPAYRDWSGPILPE